MLIIALVIATLMASVRQQTRVAGARERRTALLYAMSRELAATRGVASMARVAVRHVAEVFECRAIVLLPDDTGKLQYPSERRHRSVVARRGSGGRTVGHRSRTPGRARLGYASGRARTRTCRWETKIARVGVLAVLPSNPRRVLLPEQRHLLGNLCRARSDSHSNELGWPKRQRPHAWRRRARICVIRCLPPSRTTCARPWR